MEKKELMIVNYSETPVTLNELCEICHISSDTVSEYVSYAIIHPIGTSTNEWHFDLNQLQRMQTAMRLSRDLEINMQGVAMVLDLLDELNELREQMQVFEKHYR